MVCSDQEEGGILTVGGLADVVKWRDAAEVGETLGLVTAAVVADPGVAYSELLESEQVHHPGIVIRISNLTSLYRTYVKFV